jgi:hypothetical protein
MSGVTAVGAVGASLQRLLSDRIGMHPAYLTTATAVTVSVGTPPPEPETEDPIVNLFLYRVSSNGALSNQMPPGRGERGAYGHPPLALNLYYLLTTYGASAVIGHDTLQNEISAHDLLGHAMRILNDYPILTPAIETSGGVPVLGADLVEASEAVKITIDPLSLEDLSKVWTALSRPYRPSAAYEVSVVQIDTALLTRNAQPVGPIVFEEGPFTYGPRRVPGGPMVTAVAGSAPTIDDLHAATRTSAQVRVGETLVLEGSGLLGDATEVTIDGLVGIAQVTSAREDRLTVLIGDDVRLGPGVRTLRVSHGAMIGEPLRRRATFVSNTVAFALVPRVEAVALAGGVLTIDGNRLRAPDVECVTLIGEQTVIDYDPASTPTSLRMALPAGLDAGVPARVFVRVNGAQSIDQVTVTP